MTLLITGVIVFIAIHLVPSFPSARAGAINRMGAGPYKGLFSVGALTGVTLMVLGFAQADFVPVWQPPAWGRHVTMTVMLPVFVLLAGAHMRGNLKRFVRHPMLLGVGLWSVAHLFANGDQASVILFGALGVFALFAMWSATRRGAAKSTERVSVKFDFIVIAAGSVAYAAILFLHPYLFGMPVLP